MYVTTLQNVYMIFGLLLIFQIKHYLADYPYQNEYMLGKFKPGWDFVGPLASHCSVHAFFTIVISIAILHSTGSSIKFAFVLGLIDFVAHFIMDRIKAGPKYLGRFKGLSAKEYPTATAEERISNVWFWKSLGIDQGVHHVTHYAIIFLLWAKATGYWEVIFA